MRYRSSNPLSAFSAPCCAWNAAAYGGSPSPSRIHLATARSPSASSSHRTTASCWALIDHLALAHRPVVERPNHVLATCDFVGIGDEQVHRDRDCHGAPQRDPEL